MMACRYRLLRWYLTNWYPSSRCIRALLVAIEVPSRGGLIAAAVQLAFCSIIE